MPRSPSNNISKFGATSLALGVIVCYLVSFVRACELNSGVPCVKSSLSELKHGNEKITVSWSDIPDAEDTDALYIMLKDGNKAGEAKLITVGYYPMTTIPTYETGSGSVTFQLFHPRENEIYFAYIRPDAPKDYFADDFENESHDDDEHSLVQPETEVLGSLTCASQSHIHDFLSPGAHRTRLSNPTEDAETRMESIVKARKSYTTISISDPVVAADPSTPHQVHLALTHDPTEMLITYTTGANPASPEERKYASYDYDKVDSSSPRFIRTPLYNQYHSSNSLTSSPDFVYYSATPFTSGDNLRVTDCPEDPVWKSAGTRSILADGSIPVRRVRAMNAGAGALSEYQTYRLGEMCGSPANVAGNYYFPGIFREVLLRDLVPGKQYYYSLGGAVSDTIVPRREFSFFAAPASGNKSEADFFAFGDLGASMDYYSPVDQQPAAGPTVRGIARILDERERNGTSRPSMVLHIGDISYARGHIVHWDHFFAQLEPVASRVPWMVTMGNHDTVDPTNMFIVKTYANDAGGECGIACYRRFTMPRDFLPTPYGQNTNPIPMPDNQPVPTPGSPDDQARSVAFSFDFGPVHFTVFSAEHNFTMGSHQYNFVAADLEAVDRTKTPWVVLTSHRPLYCSTMGCGLPNRDSTGLDDMLRTLYEPLMLKNGVDLGLWGHIHAYERTCGITGGFRCGEKDEDGPVHLVIGMAGHPYNGNWINIMSHNPATEEASKLHHEQPEWSIFRTMNFGFTHFETNMTHLHMRYINNQRGTVHDEIYLSKIDGKKTRRSMHDDAEYSTKFGKAREDRLAKKEALKNKKASQKQPQVLPHY